MNKNIVVILVFALATGLGLWISQQLFSPNKLAIATKPVLTVTTIINVPRALPAFSLQSATTVLTAKQLQGSWTVIFIGFTHCPDVCPTTLADLARAQTIWAQSNIPNKPKVLFVSIDPERDSPTLLADYAAFFNKDTLTATATEPQLSKLIHALGLVYMKVPQAGSSYTMDHSATLVLLNQNAEFAGLIRPPFNPEAIANDLLNLSKNLP
jgi:protein SCO1/2